MSVARVAIFIDDGFGEGDGGGGGGNEIKVFLSDFRFGELGKGVGLKGVGLGFVGIPRINDMLILLKHECLVSLNTGAGGGEGWGLDDVPF
jgi:hypothetical protein